MRKTFIVSILLIRTAMSMRTFQSYPDISRPILEDVYTTAVTITMSIEDLKITSTKTLEAHLTALVNQRWLDPRLGADMETRRKAVAGQIWEPKITNLNGLAQVISDEDIVFWRGYGEEVLLSRKMQVTSSCTEYFHKFPFDKQICEFQFGSYRFPHDEVSIIWGKPSLVLKLNKEINEFKLTNVTTFIETDVRDSGNFSVAAVQFTINRLSSHYIYCMAIPCFIIVCLSYISLWFGPERISMRFYVSFSCFMILLFLYYTSVCQTLSTSYMKGSDVFVIINLSFVYVSLLQNFIVGTICNSRGAGVHLETRQDNNKGKKSSTHICWLENGFRIILPASYICCLLLYYYTYTH